MPIILRSGMMWQKKSSSYVPTINWTKLLLKIKHGMIIIPNISQKILFPFAKTITHTHTHTHTHAHTYTLISFTNKGVLYRCSWTNECLIYPFLLQIFSTMDYFGTYLSSDSISDSWTAAWQEGLEGHSWVTKQQ